MARPRSFRMLACVVISGAVAGIATVACVDLFHSTDFADFTTDGDSPVDAAQPSSVPSDLCTGWSASDARAAALRTCALVSSCLGPIGHNAPGSCIAEALTVLDCPDNGPSNLIGERETYWRAMANAKSCTDVLAIAFPEGRALCGGVGSYCSRDNAGAAVALAYCASVDAGPLADICGAHGQKCITTASGHVECASSDNPVACAPPDQPEKCNLAAGSVERCVKSTVGRIDYGEQCSTLANGKCAEVSGEPDGDGGTVLRAGCYSSTATTKCTPSNGTTCSGSVSHACPYGEKLQFDCSALTDGKCTPLVDAGAPAAIDGCRANAGTGCEQDHCDGANVVACVRNNPIKIVCADQGLGACQSVTIDGGTQVACNPQK